MPVLIRYQTTRRSRARTTISSRRPERPSNLSRGSRDLRKQKGIFLMLSITNRRETTSIQVHDPLFRSELDFPGFLSRWDLSSMETVFVWCQFSIHVPGNRRTHQPLRHHHITKLDCHCPLDHQSFPLLAGHSYGSHPQILMESHLYKKVSNEVLGEANYASAFLSWRRSLLHPLESIPYKAIPYPTTMY